MKLFKHPTAVVESENIGEGTKIWRFVHVREGAKIGRGCIVGKSAYIDLDVEIGDRVKIQNFVSVYKGVKIEDDVFIGPSVTFTNDLYPRADAWGEVTHTVVKKAHRSVLTRQLSVALQSVSMRWSGRVLLSQRISRHLRLFMETPQGLEDV